MLMSLLYARRVAAPVTQEIKKPRPKVQVKSMKQLLLEMEDDPEVVASHIFGEQDAQKPLGEGLRVLEAMKVALHLHNTTPREPHGKLYP